MSPRRFLRDAGGSTVVVFALTIPLIIGAAAYAVDLGYYKLVRNQLQSAADAAALGATSLVSDEDAAIAMALELAEMNVPEGFGTVVTAADVTLGTYDPATKTFTPSLSNRNAVAVAASRDATHGNAAPRYLSMIWGNEAVAIDAYAIAARTGQATYEPPAITWLDPEAGDYNQIYVYCFDYESPGDPNARRSQMTLIADNEGTEYDYDWPTCGDGEALSFRMRNVRHARAYPDVWNNPNRAPYKAELDFFTDTAIADGVESFTIRREVTSIPRVWRPYFPGGRYSEGTFQVLETVRCDSLDECVGESDGGILPQGRNRTPNLEEQPCEPGKFMYFGWEDRPPGQPGPNANWTDPAWTDTDFDDIRIVMKCPAAGFLGDKLVRLVR